MRFLITGSNGLVGQSLVNSLISKDCDFIATSKSLNINSNIPAAKFERLDITDTASLNYMVDLYKPDIIVNTAAITSVDYAELHKAETWSVNVVGVENLVNTVLKRNIKLIHLSTDFVFDGMGPFYSEEDLTDPVSYYGYTKLEGEKRVEILQNACIIRTILVYGYYKDMVRSNFVLWVYNSLKQGNEIKVVDDQYRMPTYVNDLSEAIKTIAEKEKEGLYHISGNEYLSIFEFAKTIASMFNLDDNLIKPVSSFMLDQVGKRPPKTGFNLDKAASELNYLPTSIKEALTKMKQLMD